MKKKVLSIFGTRPEAIKMAPIVKTLDSDERFESLVCVTGQHREMLDQVLSAFDIQPDLDLDIMTSGQTLNDITSSIICALKPILDDIKPHVVLVHGDTATSFAASLASFYNKVPIAHVEAGLRTGNIYSPWPEEGNRRLNSVLASYHFAPTDVSKQNLLNENISEEKVYVVGNTVIDALHLGLKRISKNQALEKSLNDKFSFIKKSSKVLLVTGHRRENFGDGFKRICEAILKIAREFPDCQIIYPVHLNPNVRSVVNQMLGKVVNVHLIEPLDYLPFIHLMNKSSVILTDSGGIQEEAPSLGKPVLVMRETTERPEAVQSGIVRLVGTDVEAIVSSVSECFLSNKDMARVKNPYGNGDSSILICDILSRVL